MTMDISTIVLLFCGTCFGIIIGSLIQHALDRRSSRPVGSSSPRDTSTAEQPTWEGDVEVLRAYRSLSGKTWLEMQGMRLNEQDGLNSDQRRNLVSLLIDLRPWLEPAATKPDIPKPWPVSPGSSLPSAQKGKPDQESTPAPEMKSIVQQIDDMLQSRLSARAITGREICLVEGPGGTVIVRDGLNSYEGVEAVPDPEIRLLIREAVTEWEKRSR
jgi:hypothetical protein